MKILYILIAIAVLLLMVIIHEFGHYIAGKILKFKINEFSVGFGPKIFSKKNKKTGEVFSLRVVPLGGYCAFDGEEDIDEPSEADKENAVVFNEIDDVAARPENQAEPSIESEPKKEGNDLKKFNDQKPWKRMIVLVSGAMFNLISAVIFSFLFILIVGYNRPKIAYVAVNPETGIEYNSDLHAGDVIVAVNGKKITVMKSFDDMKIGDSAVFTVLRDGRTIDITVKKYAIAKQEYEFNGETGVLEYDEGVLAFGFVRTNDYKNASLGTAVKYMIPFTGKMSVAVIKSLGMLITGKVGITQITGPIGTIDTIADYTIMNWRNLFLLLPLIAANLGIFNLLPIPALDGSKVVFTLIEWIRGKPIDRKIENTIHAVGMLVLFGLVIIIDILGMILRAL